MKIHSSTLVLFFLSASLWALSCYSALQSLESTFTVREQRWLHTLRVLLKLSAVVAGLAAVEWHFAYTTYANSFLNESMEATCEWILVGLAIILPAVQCQFFRGFALRFSLQTPVEQKKEVELSKL